MNRLFSRALLLLLFGGAFCVVRAQQTDHPQTAKDLPKKITVAPGYKGPPFFTFKGTYYGFLSDTKDRRLGTKVTPDQVRKSVAEGATYTLLGGGGFGGGQFEPADKADAYAGQWVTIRALSSSNTYGTGATSEPSIDGYPAGDGTVSNRTRPPMKIVSITKDTPPNDDTNVTTVGGAGIRAEDVGPGYGVSTPGR